MKVVSLLHHLHSLLLEPFTTSIARCHPFDFIRSSPLQVPTLLKYILCRTCKTTTNEIMTYFSSIDDLESTVSKQAIFQAREKVDPNVFRYLNEQLMKHYYLDKDTKTLKGYTVIAMDGSVMEVPYNDACVECFGVSTTNKSFTYTKTSPRMSAMYDVLNDVFVDVSIDHYQTSEIPLAHEQLWRMQRNYPETNLLYLADRNYGSIDTFMYLENNNNSYCFRGKKNCYKAQVGTVEKDGIINISLTKQWIDRFKIEEVKEYARDNPEIEIRVIKFKKSEVIEVEDGKKDEEIILFTNLKEGWTREEIIDLYRKRWKIETGIDVLKTKQEVERVTSEKPQLILQDMYSQVVVHTIVTVAKEEVDTRIQRTSKYEYQANINNLLTVIRKNLAKLLNVKEQREVLVKKIIEVAKKKKEPIRPNRFYKRWDVYIKKPTRLKFRVDGKRNPRVHKTKNGYLRVKA